MALKLILTSTLTLQGVHCAQETMIRMFWTNISVRSDT